MKYAEAVAAAERLLQAYSELGGGDVRLRYGQTSLRDENIALQGHAMLTHDPALFMRVMQETAGGIDTMRKTAAYCVREGLEMPPAFAAWAARFLFGMVEPPKGKRGRKLLHQDEAALRQHWAICETVAYLVAHGFNATRNDTSPPLSACDAVAEARRNLDLRQLLSYDGVQNVWASRVGKE